MELDSGGDAAVGKKASYESEAGSIMVTIDDDELEADLRGGESNGGGGRNSWIEQLVDHDGTRSFDERSPTSLSVAMGL
eukprot:EC794068.1.p3 GENE.EC794068.1~~EC794068.1.p3  ORF type:complete len:79 (+),score=11.13 EC794068.1:184-420(+)